MLSAARETNAWFDSDPAVPIKRRLDDLEKLVVGGAIPIPRCFCGPRTEDEMEAIFYCSDEIADVPSDARLTQIAAKILTGYVDHWINQLSHPLTTSALSSQLNLHTLSYAHEPDYINRTWVLEDLNTVASHPQALSSRELRQVKDLLELLGADRNEYCICFPGDESTATAAERQEWVQQYLRRWGEHDLACAEELMPILTVMNEPRESWLAAFDLFLCANTIAAFGRGARPGDPWTHWHDAPGAEAISDTVHSTDLYPHTRRLLERWNDLEDSELHQSPHDLYTALTS